MTTTDGLGLLAAWAVVIAMGGLGAAGVLGWWVRGLFDERRARSWARIRQQAGERSAAEEEPEFTEPEAPIAKQVIPQNRFTLPVEDLYRPGDYVNPQACAECEVPFTAGQAVLQFGSGALHTLVCLRCGDELPDLEIEAAEEMSHG